MDNLSSSQKINILTPENGNVNNSNNLETKKSNYRKIALVLTACVLIVLIITIVGLLVDKRFSLSIISFSNSLKPKIETKLETLRSDTSSCGETSIITSLNKEIKEDSNAYRCLVQAFNQCQKKNLIVHSSDWEGGQHTSLYEILTNEQGSCDLRITSETKAFYISYGFSKTRQICKTLSLDNGKLKTGNCSNPEFIYDFCSDWNNEYKDLCKTHEAAEKKDVNICNQINWEWGKQDCITEVSNTTNDTSTCEKLNKDRSKGQCIAAISLRTNTFKCNYASTKNIETECIGELLKFHNKEMNNLKGIEAIKNESTITVPLGSDLWSSSTQALERNSDGTIALWLNGTRHSCRLGVEVFLRSDGPYCSPSIPVYHVTKCTLNGNNVTLNYFTYDTDCKW